VIRAPLYEDSEDGPAVFNDDVLTSNCLHELREHPFTLAHFHEPVAVRTLIAFHELGIPVLLTEHSAFAEDSARVGSGCIPGAVASESMLELCRRDRQCLEIADAVICVSAGIAKELLKTPGRIPPIRIIENGISVKRFTEVDRCQVKSIRDQLTVAPGGRLVMFAGRACGNKGFGELVVASSIVRSKIPTVHFAFLIANFDQLALKRTGLSDVLPGGSTIVSNVQQVQMPAYYAAADIVVVPSRSDYFPMVALEAMAAGRPLIVSDIDPLDSLISDGVNGRVVHRVNGPAGVIDVAELSQAICELAQKPSSELNDMGQIGRERVLSQYSAARMVERTSCAYRDLLDGVWTPETCSNSVRI
jgi:glycosyltransferase involved in cell wall biosynthesis